MKEIELSKGYIASVDDCDYEYLMDTNWFAQETGGLVYAVSNYTQEGVEKRMLMHRSIGELMGLDSSLETDHIDGNGLNNIRSNIRSCTRQQNLRNRRKTSSVTASKYKGVVRSRNKWKSAITIDSVRYHLGVFDLEVDAAKSYNEAAVKYFGEFAKLNEIPDANR